MKFGVLSDPAVTPVGVLATQMCTGVIYIYIYIYIAFKPAEVFLTWCRAW
jgi:hypothetical protein